MRRSSIYFLALIILASAAAARTQKVMLIQASKDGDCRAELQIKSEDGSIIAGCKSSPQSKNYETYWMKSDSRGNKLCVEKSKRDDVTRGHYLQNNADGSSLVASYESSPEKSNHIHFLLKGSSGDELQVTGEDENVLLKRMFNLDQEMNIYMKAIQKNLRGASAIHRNWDSFR